MVVIWRGREKLHYLNPVPIHEIADRWIGKFERGRLRALAELKKDWKERPMADSRFVYVTYIRTTPEKLWQALIEPEFTRQYWVRHRQESRMEAGRVLADHDSRRPRRRQRRDSRNRAAAAARARVAQRVPARAARRRLFAA